MKQNLALGAVHAASKGSTPSPVRPPSSLPSCVLSTAAKWCSFPRTHHPSAQVKHCWKVHSQSKVLSLLNSLFLPTEPGKYSIFKTCSGPASNVSQHSLLLESKGIIIASRIGQIQLGCGVRNRKETTSSFLNWGSLYTQKFGNTGEGKALEVQAEDCAETQSRKAGRIEGGTGIGRAQGWRFLEEAGTVAHTSCRGWSFGEGRDAVWELDWIWGQGEGNFLALLFLLPSNVLLTCWLLTDSGAWKMQPAGEGDGCLRPAHPCSLKCPRARAGALWPRGQIQPAACLCK